VWFVKVPQIKNSPPYPIGLYGGGSRASRGPQGLTHTGSGVGKHEDLRHRFFAAWLRWFLAGLRCGTSVRPVVLGLAGGPFSIVSRLWPFNPLGRDDDHATGRPVFDNRWCEIVLWVFHGVRIISPQTAAAARLPLPRPAPHRVELPRYESSTERYPRGTMCGVAVGHARSSPPLPEWGMGAHFWLTKALTTPGSAARHVCVCRRGDS